MTSTTNSRFMDNVDKLLSHFKSIETSFESSEHMYDITSNAVLSESVASDITNQQSIKKRCMKVLSVKGYMKRKAFRTL